MRTDSHSEKALRPEDYRVVRYLYTKLPSFVPHVAAYAAEVDAFRREMEAVRAMLDERGANIHRGWSQCDHCGAHYHHGLLLEHEPTGELITVGWQCAENRFSLGNVAYQRRRMEKVVKAIRARRIRIGKLRTFVGEHREEVRLLDEFRGVAFFDSLRSQLIARGELSDRQIGCLPEAAERQRRWRQEREDRKAREASLPKSPVIEGKKVEIVGEVLTCKEQVSDYGLTLKMLVRDDRGFKVWGTVPKRIDGLDDGTRLRGQRIVFTAGVERSRDDECFGFFKRPRLAAVVEAQIA